MMWTLTLLAVCWGICFGAGVVYLFLGFRSRRSAPQLAIGHFFASALLLPVATGLTIVFLRLA